MKIAITAEQPTADGAVSLRFGRAPHILIYDAGSGEYAHLDNTANADLPQAAGIQTAQAVADAGAEVLITGRVGPKAADALKAGGVKAASVDGGTVRQAVQNYLDGQLRAETPEAHPDAPGSAMGPGSGGGRGAAGGGQGLGGGGRGRGVGGGGRGQGGGGRGRGMGGGGRGQGGGGRGRS